MVQLFVRSCDLTCHDLYCSYLNACTHHSTLQLPPSVFVFATFRCSDGRSAERAAAQVDYMVESLLLHRYSLPFSSTLSSTVTVDCAALAPHTGVERHRAIRLRAHPAVATQLCQLTSSSGPTRDVTRDASTELLQPLHGYMKQHNVDFIEGDFNMSAFSKVCDVFSDRRSRIVSALGFSSCPSAHMSGVWIHMDATSTIPQRWASDLVINPLTSLCSYISAPLTCLAPTASCAANMHNKEE